MRTVHQGKKRTDNEKRKREVTDKAEMQGILEKSEIRPFEDSVESILQVAFKTPKDYVAIKAHRQSILTFHLPI